MMATDISLSYSSSYWQITLDFSLYISSGACIVILISLNFNSGKETTGHDNVSCRCLKCA